MSAETTVASAATTRLPHTQQQQAAAAVATIGAPAAAAATASTTNAAATTSAATQQYQQHISNPHSKADEIEILESAAGGTGGTGGAGGTGGGGNVGVGGGGGSSSDEQHADKYSTGWICCAPCVWLRTSAAVHKIAITTATLLVTSLLVASPVLFLLSTAPSQLPRECSSSSNRPDDLLDCVPMRSPPPECESGECEHAALTLLARMNWQLDVCQEFRDFACAPTEGSLKVVRSAQEEVDLQMLHLLTHNTTTGPFRKLGRLYGSCLRQRTNSSAVRLRLDALGGYLPIGALGPASLTPLFAAMQRLAAPPLVAIYYDLSYGQRPQRMLVVDGAAPQPQSAALQAAERWRRPKAPPPAHGARDLADEPVAAQLRDVVDTLVSGALSAAQRDAERAAIVAFMRELRQLREETLRGDYADSFVMYNVTQLSAVYTFLNWSELIAPGWTGPILVRSGDYLKGLQRVLARTQRRVVHNAALVMFALSVLPAGRPDALVCARATMWALPEAAGALYAAQFGEADVRERFTRTEVIFEVLKAWLKRAPSLKGAALVKLSQLRVQTALWPALLNASGAIEAQLNRLQVSSDNWFDNVLEIYRVRRADAEAVVAETSSSSSRPPQETNNGTAWSYPTIARVFYDSLSHSILVPLSIVQTAYFNPRLQPYMHYAGVGAAIATEILRSITRQFDEKLLQCVPRAVGCVTNTSHMDVLCQSGGMQIAYHSMLSLSGPLKGQQRLPGVNMSPTQLFYLVFGQTVCAAYEYAGVPVRSEEFGELLSWLIAQGGSATQVFQCSYYSAINQQKSCNVL